MDRVDALRLWRRSRAKLAVLVYRTLACLMLLLRREPVVKSHFKRCRAMGALQQNSFCFGDGLPIFIHIASIEQTAASCYQTPARITEV